jgi:hypothetical protein
MFFCSLFYILLYIYYVVLFASYDPAYLIFFAAYIMTLCFPLFDHHCLAGSMAVCFRLSFEQSTTLVHFLAAPKKQVIWTTLCPSLTWGCKLQATLILDLGM